MIPIEIFSIFIKFDITILEVVSKYEFNWLFHGLRDLFPPVGLAVPFVFVQYNCYFGYGTYISRLCVFLSRGLH